ncbi:MAG: A/G-specific adenine glycosylase [Candidatus Protochlamydia sp.]|nr:A/G-specific adenine glycosylase [Candidatus Protochlamydia sp.]
MKNTFDHSNLKHWFESIKRDLPWRKLPEPYAVWISEVMLQQTQVSVVVPYFQKWMETFPTVQALAAAPMEKVIKAWEGLGYYSRARNLHEGAKHIMLHHNGMLPSDEAQLAAIKGLGPYTIGAILSFAFHQKKAAVDGNVLRVLSRYFHLDDDISKGKTQKKLRLLAESILPDEEPWIVSEALIELGATVCQKKARCYACPLKGSCLSFQHQSADRLPVNSKKIKTEKLYRAVAVIQFNDHYLVKKGKKGEIMSDLTEFPYFDTAKEGISFQELKEKIQHHFHLSIRTTLQLPHVLHGFTRFQARLAPVIFNVSFNLPVQDFEWVALEELKQRAFSSGHRRIWQNVLYQNQLK